MPFPDAEAPETVARNVAVGVRIWAGATTFAFLGPLFGYLYLRSLNTADLWRPPGVDPPQALGAAILLLPLASSTVLLLASRASRPSRRLPDHLVALSLLLGLVAVGLQVVEYATLGFGPTDGGYASVFVAWTGLNAAFILGTMLWLWTFAAYRLRTRGRADEAEGGSDPLMPERLAALAFSWVYLAGLGVVMWICLYLAA